MTKAEIIAELRRSAMEDRNPWKSVSDAAWGEAFCVWTDHDEIIVRELSAPNKCRTFYLLVAHALEDEC